MATPDEIQQKLAQLRASNPGVPGVTFDTVIDPLVETKFKTSLEQAKTPEERAALKQQLLTSMKNEGRLAVEQQIDALNSSFAALQTVASSLLIAATSLPATIAATTSAAAAPPIAANILALIGAATTAAMGILSNAAGLGISIPDAALAPIDALIAVKSLIPSPSSIPVPPTSGSSGQ